MEKGITNDSLFNLSTTSNITCRDDFYLLNNNTCIPRCDRFEEHPHIAIQTMLITETTAGLIALATSVLVLALSIYNRKNM